MRRRQLHQTAVNAMPNQIMSDHEIVRGLRLLTQPRPMSIVELAARTGLSRETIYQARNGRLTHRVRLVLSQVLAEVLPSVR